MSDFVMGFILYLLPGIVAYGVPSEGAAAQSHKKQTGRIICFIEYIITILCIDFAALTIAYGLCFALFGKQVFSPVFGMPERTFLSENIFCRVLYLVFAYVTALFFAAVYKTLRHERILPSYYVSVGTILFCVLAWGVGYDAQAGSRIMFSEICSNNQTILTDEYGESSDYIELYNPSATSVSLNGYRLAKEENGEGISLDGYDLAPHSYLLLYADERNDAAVSSVGLALSAEGDSLYLYDSADRCIDSVQLPALPADTAYARLGDEPDTWEVVKYGSPGADNRTLTAYTVPTLTGVSFSAESGFYEEDFFLSMESEPGRTIYYTTDGTAPTTESTVYTGPILIQDASGQENYYAAIKDTSIQRDYCPDELLDKACVVRAMCTDENGAVSDIATAVYFVGFDEKEGYDDIKILAMNAEPEDLFSDERGIYVLGDAYREYIASVEEPDYNAYTPANYWKKGSTAQRVAYLALFDADRGLLAEGKAGIRIHGGSTRSYRQKGFNFYDSEQDDGTLSGIGRYMLRTSGAKDTFLTMLRDVFGQSLVEERAAAIQRGEPCALFLNGEYWGLYNLQERYSAAYFEEHYGIPEDNLVVLKDSRTEDVTTTRVTVGQETDLKLYEDLLSYAQETDLSAPEAYEKISEMMDIQSFIDYFAVEMYIGNTDWPVNNVCRFRSRESSGTSVYEDGRWRWALYDTDESTGGGSTGYDMNPFDGETYYHKVSPMETVLMQNLLANEDFKRQFCVSFLDIINKNFAYSPVHDKLYEMAEIYALPMVKSYQRFNQEEFTTDDFWDNIAVLDEFFQKRPDFVISYLAEAMGISADTGQITLQCVTVESDEELAALLSDEPSDEMELSPEGGEIVLNTITPDMNQGEWSGTYLAAYPITVTAVAADGYRFAGWQGSLSSEEETIQVGVPEDQVCLRAVFVKEK
jgi:hypothetical protein